MAKIKDSVGMDNVKRFKSMFNIERGIWLTIPQLKLLAKELGEIVDKDNNPCSGVGFMVGVGKDMRFNVEIIPLVGHSEDAKDKVDGDKLITEYDWKDENGKIRDHFSRTIERKVIWKGNFLERSVEVLNIPSNADDKEKASITMQNSIMQKYKDEDVDVVCGLYAGTIQITHEASHNEAQRFPPPEV